MDKAASRIRLPFLFKMYYICSLTVVHLPSITTTFTLQKDYICNAKKPKLVSGEAFVTIKTFKNAF